VLGFVTWTLSRSIVVAHFFSPEMTLDILKEALFIACGILFYVTVPHAHLRNVCARAVAATAAVAAVVSVALLRRRKAVSVKQDIPAPPSRY
jgi:hypothetical protein